MFLSVVSFTLLILDSNIATNISNPDTLNATIYEVIRTNMQYLLYLSSPTYALVVTHDQLERYAPPKMLADTNVKIIIHGTVWNTTYSDNVKYNYMMYEDASVIIVDWTSVKKELLRSLKAAGPRYIGKCVSEMLTIVFENSTYYNKTHIIAHSYGAHIAGYIGRILQERGFSLQRITGLDAANPYIPSGLDKADASFVDVINIVMKQNVWNTIGHMDFYPNAGEVQPSCAHETPYSDDCNSLQSYEYFAQTIKQPRRYLANRCQRGTISEKSCTGSTAHMGNAIDVKATGVYYLNTKVFKRVSRIF